MLLDVPTRPSIPPRCRREHAIEPEAGQLLEPRPVHARRPGETASADGDHQLAHECDRRMLQPEQAKAGDALFLPGAETGRPAVEQVGAVELRQGRVDVDAGAAWIEGAGTARRLIARA